MERYGRSVLKAELKNNIQISLSGEKEWIPVLIGDRDISIENEITFSLSLKREDPAVVGYNDVELKDGFETTLPVVKFVLDNNGLDAFRDLDLSLAAGVDQIVEGDEDLFFLPGEFVSRKEADGDCIYRSNSEFIGGPEDIEAQLEQPLWLAIANLQSLIFPYEDRAYIAGELVSFGEGIYRATANFVNIAPDGETTLWQDFSENTYDAVEGYQAGRFGEP